jgi:acyl-homoserine lactone acylase PvdQ
MAKTIFYGCIFLALVLALGWLNHKFNHATAAGPKKLFTDCQVIESVKGSVPQFSSEKIEIHTGQLGIKYVEAESYFGAVYGLGFVHAQDRLWQLNFWRGMSRGRLSEIFGSETMPMDRYIRTIGATRMVEDYMARIDQSDLILLENYAAGVNKMAE